ncbi:hypothetical protein Tco_0326613 [Tanacetum coccineum]
MIIIRGRSPESRGSGGSAPGSKVQGAAAPGSVQGAEPLAWVELPGKYWRSELTREKHQEVMNTIWSIWNTLVAETPIETNANPMPSKVSADPIVQSVSIEKPSSYVRAVVGSEPETSLDDVMENGPWMIRNSPIILKKCSMDTRLCKEEGRSSFACCLIEIDAKDVLKESLTMGAPLIEGPGRVMMDSKRWFVGLSVKQNLRYEPKATTSASKKGATNAGNASKSSSMLKTTRTSSEKGKFTTSNLYFALDDESEKDVENVYDESANLFPNSKTDESSSLNMLLVSLF